MQEDQRKEANMSNNLRSNQSASSCSCYSSSSLALARTFRNCERMMGGRVLQPAWSMSSLLTALPQSPSPICSYASATRTCHSRSHYSDYATEFSSPRNQVGWLVDLHSFKKLYLCFSWTQISCFTFQWIFLLESLVLLSLCSLFTMTCCMRDF